MKHLTVLENIFLGAEISRHGVLDYDTMTLRCEKLLAQVSLAISPDTRVGDRVWGNNSWLKSLRR